MAFVRIEHVMQMNGVPAPEICNLQTLRSFCEKCRGETENGGGLSHVDRVPMTSLDLKFQKSSRLVHAGFDDAGTSEGRTVAEGGLAGAAYHCSRGTTFG